MDTQESMNMIADTPLLALKRAAKAILKQDEEAHQAALDHLRTRNDHLVVRNDALEEQVKHLKERSVRAESALEQVAVSHAALHKWQGRHEPRNIPLKASIEWLVQPRDGTSFRDVHPFDRWGISPKP